MIVVVRLLNSKKAFDSRLPDRDKDDIIVDKAITPRNRLSFVVFSNQRNSILIYISPWGFLETREFFFSLLVEICRQGIILIDDLVCL